MQKYKHEMGYLSVTNESAPPGESNNANRDKTLRHIARVLIVEDTLELGEIITHAVKRLNVYTYHEQSGLRALTTYQALRPDIVLLDIGLPDMNGWKLLDAIKESQSSPRRPAVVVITAFSDPANRVMGKLQGVYGYLVKPFTLDTVTNIVAEILAEQANERGVR